MRGGAERYAPRHRHRLRVDDHQVGIALAEVPGLHALAQLHQVVMGHVDRLAVRRDGQISGVRIDRDECSQRGVLGGELQDESGDRPGAMRPVRPRAGADHRLAQIQVGELAAWIGGHVMRAFQLDRDEPDGDVPLHLASEGIDGGDLVASVVGGEEQAVQGTGRCGIGGEPSAVEDGFLGLAAAGAHGDRCTEEERRKSCHRRPRASEYAASRTRAAAPAPTDAQLPDLPGEVGVPPSGHVGVLTSAIWLLVSSVTQIVLPGPAAGP